ncbi:serine hydrolase domain-containing protein [Streptomyces sp. NPDC058613]|uniref:serine hydrolase domain-containing protein n=1 Tax=Streptomyces sp. NPDC058613 TaxID=3346556 RepID=UPI0036630FEE
MPSTPVPSAATPSARTPSAATPSAPQPSAAPAAKPASGRGPHAGRRALQAGAAALLLLLTGVAAAPAAPARAAVSVPAVTAAPGAAPGAATGAAPGAATAVPQELDPATVRRLDAAIGGAMKRDRIPGAIVGVWLPGRGEYVKAFGTADTRSGIPMKSDLYMRIGSVTKTFTVTAVLQLVDQGRVALDDPISKYVAGVPGGGKITLRQLAGMRSGLFNYTEDERFLAALRADPHREFTPRQLLGHAFAHPANFAPGAKWEYSNTNTILLGLLLEEMSGQPLDGYLRHHVFDPLKLTDTSLPSGTDFPEPHAEGYTGFSPNGAVANATDWNPSWAWAAGSAVSTLDDLHAWVPALVGGRLLTPATQAQRMRTEPVGVPGISYGLGIADVNGWLGHNGELPGYETIAAQLPREQATMVIMVNSDMDQGGSYSTTLGKAVTEIVTPDHLWSLPSPSQVGQNQR